MYDRSIKSYQKPISVIPYNESGIRPTKDLWPMNYFRTPAFDGARAIPTFSKPFEGISNLSIYKSHKYLLKKTIGKIFHYDLFNYNFSKFRWNKKKNEANDLFDIGICVNEIKNISNYGPILDEFDERICLIIREKRQYRLYNPNSKYNIVSNHIEDLPVVYVYKPINDQLMLTNNDFRNILLLTHNFDYDFFIISRSLKDLPFISLGRIEDYIIIKKEKIKENISKLKGTGKIIRLLPGDNEVRDITIGNIFSSKITYDSIMNIISVGIFSKKKKDNLTAKNKREFYSFNKTKKTILVFPIYLAVGGVEKNTIEIMKALKFQYDFLIANFEKLNEKTGSLHHLAIDECAGIYDLSELTESKNYLSILKQIKDAYRPNIIWICNGSPWLCDNALKIREIFKDIPIVDQEVYDIEEGWINGYNGPGIRSFDRFIAINSKIYDCFLNKYNMDKNKIDLIYHAIDEQKFDRKFFKPESRDVILKKYNLPENKRIFIFIGRLCEQKRPFDFLELVRNCSNGRENPYFLMIGQGELSQDVKEYISKNNLKNLSYFPFVEDPSEIYYIASGLIISSRYEGLPIVMLEALSMGVPILSTDVGDIKLFLEKYKSGMIINEIGNIPLLIKSYKDWKDRLYYYQNNAEKSAHIIRQFFSSQRIARKYKDTWEKAMKDKKYEIQEVS